MQFDCDFEHSLCLKGSNHGTLFLILLFYSLNTSTSTVLVATHIFKLLNLVAILWQVICVDDTSFDP